MPAEWEPHAATWLAWPREKPEWGTKMHAVPWVFGEVVRALARRERVEILCDGEATIASARQHLEALGVAAGAYRLHDVPNDRVWLRDTGPTGVLDAAGRLEWIGWLHGAVAQSPGELAGDAVLARAVARLTTAPLHEALAPDGTAVVLEGGAFDVDGSGLLVATEACLLGDHQPARNPSMRRADFEHLFDRRLGARRVVWLGGTCAGDRTRGHVDLVARFVAPGALLLAVEDDPADDENHRVSTDNLRRLSLDAPDVRVIRLPFPEPRTLWGDRLPCTYANFYVANGVVLVPTFNDPADRVALAALAGAFPGRRVVGIDALDLVWGHGAIHCATRQEPASVA